MPLLLPLADIFRPESLAVMVPIMLCMVPIIAILTGHQRKMAEIMHGAKGSVDPRLVHEIDALRHEMAEVKTLLHQQAIAIDNLAPRLAPPAEIVNRLENVGR